MRRCALLVLLVSAVAGCGEGAEEREAHRATQETFEMPTYRFHLPTGWTAGIDQDPAAQEGAGFRSDDEHRVHGGISRSPVAEVAAAGLGASARERIVNINEGHRGVANVVEIGEVERLTFDIDGEDAWRTEARFGTAQSSFHMVWVAFQHDGQDYVVTFEGAEPLDESDVAGFEELLRSWEFV
jgi:hypothetical protein